VEYAGIDMRDLMPAATGNNPSDAKSTELVIVAQIAENFVDILGVVNDRRLTENRDIIHGAEIVPAWRVSNQESVRRTSLHDTNDNYNGFRGVRWEAGDGAIADGQMDIFRPRGSSAGSWTPEFPEPNWQPPVVEGIEIQHLGNTITALQLFEDGPDVQLTAVVTPARPGEAVRWSVYPEDTVVTVDNKSP